MNLKRKFLLICGGMSSVILSPLALVSTNPTTNDGTENGANIALGEIYRTKWFRKRYWV
ncbi:hypothetical protein [Mycoplasmopsis cynos]|uniref:hypothetical protein n=1 Tax=Mycoplasmopsis cynos TaxID=171284 RepID=UPI002207ED1E|nr:hypothetical protein [Mycoplasmopsis cynos]UWV92554.1 hypothetical protein NWE57_00210 [Mycoplasmopsis cynos]